MIKLVKYEEKHVPSLMELLDNENVSKWMINVPHPYTEEVAKEWLAITRSMEDGKDYGYAIELDGVHIGGIGLHLRGRTNPDLDNHKAEIGYWLGEPYWSKGYMSDALQQVLKIAFDNLKLIRVHACTLEGNVMSENLLLRNGFEHEGFLKKSHKKGDKIFNANLFAKVI